MNQFFNRQYTPALILFFLLIVSITPATILNSWAIHENESPSIQKINKIPDWIKNTAGWWADGEIPEVDFLQGITFLIDNEIIKIADKSIIENVDSTTDSTTTKLVPDWVKNNAGWWASGQIPDSAFVSGLEWLISNGILKVDSKRISFIPIQDVIFSQVVEHYDKTNLVHLWSSLFEVYVGPENYVMEDGIKKWISPLLGLNPNKMDLYNELALWHDPERAAVIFPVFTATAYASGGFYEYYRGECDHCTTITIKEPGLLYTSSGNAVQVLTLLGYDLLNDFDVDMNPDILKQYDKIIMLHNEYVTRTEFDAVTSHPNVIYLYPNALYAEIDVNYTDNTITLIRGHNYPEPEIVNGFDWEFDNTHPYEYDNECKTMEMYSIEDPRANVGIDIARIGANQHWMTTCYPDVIFYSSPYIATALLQSIKDI